MDEFKSKYYGKEEYAPSLKESVKKYSNKDDMRNGSGYIDPTAYEAIKRAEDEREHYKKTMGCLMRVCELAGFAVEERIILRDKKTGKVWW